MAIAVAIGNTGHSSQTPIDTTKPAWVYHPPKALHLTMREREELLRISTKFIQTAVARHNVDASWVLAGPDLRQDETRGEWDTGNIPVPPFKAAGIATWDLLYSYENDVAFDLALLGGKQERYLSKTFTIEFKRYRRPDGAHWLVASWTPRGVASVTALKPSERPKLVATPVKAPLSRWFLIVPAAIFGGMLLGFLAFGAVHTVRDRRKARRYAEALGQTSNSSPS